MTSLVIGPDTPVTICQLAEEFETLLAIYRKAKPRTVLEIGTASGGSLYHFIKNAQRGTRIVSVDRAEPDYPLDREQCRRWAREARVELYLVEGDTTAATTVETVGDLGPYDFCFIDGDHRYDGCRRDVENYGGMIETDGLLALHDIALVRDYEDGTSAGVSRVWAELRESYDQAVEIRYDPPIDAYGIGVVQMSRFKATEDS